MKYKPEAQASAFRGIVDKSAKRFRNSLACASGLYFAILALTSTTLFAADLLPEDKPIAEAVDHYLQLKLTSAGVTPAAAADDANLVRRTTLDLAGRIPTVAEARAYVELQEPDKRNKLIEQLMKSDGFIRHQANELDALLMHGVSGSLKNYLLEAVRDNRPWDQVFRDLLLATEVDPKQKGVGTFLKERVGDMDKLTNDVSVRFFGVNISCAKCHDHPLVESWKQDHFYGMKSFLNRTFESGGFLAERSHGKVKFKTTDGKDIDARLMFLSGTVIDEPMTPELSKEDEKKENEQFKELAKQKVAPPPPAYSRRAQLVELALKPGENQYLARSIVNRVWHRFFGRGLVMPLDQMHSANPASHPELLEWLARDLIAHQYDVRRLVQGLVSSAGYSRSSRWDSAQRPDPALFAAAGIRPLTPHQYSASLRLATQDPESYRSDMKPEELAKRIEDTAAGSGWASLFEMPQENFQIGVSEALLLSNSDRAVKELLADGGGKLVGRLKQTEDRKQAVETAVWTILSRPPEAEETQLLAAYFDQRGDRRLEGCQQIVWALLASAEFRFNY